MIEFAIYAAIVFVMFFIMLFALFLTDGWSGMDADAWKSIFLASLCITIISILITFAASRSASSIQDNYLEPPEPSAIERINLEKE